MTNTQILIKNIKEIMEQKGLVPLEVAERVGILPYDLEGFLTGRKVITAEYIPRMASALEVSIDALYGISAMPSVVIGNCKYSEIAVIDRNNNLIASITADNIIEEEGYKVVCAHAEN